jgi:hypothetical protein
MLYKRLSNAFLWYYPHACFDEGRWRDIYYLMIDVCYELCVTLPRRKIKYRTIVSSTIHTRMCLSSTNYCCNIGNLTNKYWKNMLLQNPKQVKSRVRKVTSDRKHFEGEESSYNDSSLCALLHIHFFMFGWCE